MNDGGSAARATILKPLQGKLVTLRSVAERRGQTRWWVAELARTDRAPGSTKFSNRWMFHADVVEAWLSGWWDPDQEPWADFAGRHGLTETRHQ